MQLEETASSKDVPHLSTGGNFELSRFVAQYNLRPFGLNTDRCVLMIFVSRVRKELRSLVC